MAGVLGPLGKTETVVERQLRAGWNLPPRDDPNPAANDFDAAVGRT